MTDFQLTVMTSTKLELSKLLRALKYKYNSSSNLLVIRVSVSKEGDILPAASDALL